MFIIVSVGRITKLLVSLLCDLSWATVNISSKNDL